MPRYGLCPPRAQLEDLASQKLYTFLHKFNCFSQGQFDVKAHPSMHKDPGRVFNTRLTIYFPMAKVDDRLSLWRPLIIPRVLGQLPPVFD